MRIAVVGMGYVGIATASGLAQLGHDVTGVDIDQTRIALLAGGTLPIYEPGLAETIRSAIGNRSLRFTTDRAEAVLDSEAVFIAVGSPTDRDGSADLSQVYDAVDQIAPILPDRCILVVKSTVPVGTTRSLLELLQSLRPDAELDVASNPEFLRQGSALHDFLEPDRLVVGTSGASAEAVMRRVYEPMLDGTRVTPSVFTNFESAELIKYASNAFLAVKLSFINEIADLCEATGADIDDVSRGVGLDPRIGSTYLSAGPGYGGSCLPKDTQALLHTSRVHGTPSRVVAAAIDVNRERRRSMTDRIAAAVTVPLTQATVTVLGITFKHGTDDLRESPAVDIVKGLLGEGVRVRVCDPQGNKQAEQAIPNARYFDDPMEAIVDADAIVFATGWPEFADLNLSLARARTRGSALIDLRNVISPQDAIRAGFHYESIGRSSEQLAGSESGYHGPDAHSKDVEIEPDR